MNNREKLELSLAEVKKILMNEHLEYGVVDEKNVGHWRHGEIVDTVVIRNDKKFFKIQWKDSTKDDVRFEDMNDAPFIAEEVFQKTKMITYYE